LAGTRDAGASRVSGFPYLRVDRLTASFAPQAQWDERRFDAWFDRARGLDREGRGAELANAALSGEMARVEDCAKRLADHDRRDADLRSALLARALVPDDYLDWQRVVGLYSLTRLPFALGVEGWHEEALRHYAAPDPPGQSRYVPSAAGADPQAITAALARAHGAADALGVPVFADTDRDLLFAAYAPVFDVETTGAYDRIGRVRWGQEPEIDASAPVIYRRLAFTRVGGTVLVQLVYTAWFSERPSSGAFDILGGKLDGVVLRVTLGRDGTPLVYDTIHPCGCYHMFYPTPRAEPVPPPDALEEWAFIPKRLPVLAPGTRVVLRIQSRSHYLTGIAPLSGAATGIPYRFEEEDALRRLPHPEGGTKSLYGPDGLVLASERPERLLFWPMGIPSAGTMRQWGRHATAFLGRRHFDDADLIDKRFRITAP